MRCRRIVLPLWLAGLVLAGACASAPTAEVSSGAAASPPAGATPPAVRLPPAVAGFTLVGRHNFEDPRAGSSFRYNGPDSLYADVFVYPGPDLATNCGVACATRVMQEEVTQFEHTDLPEMLRRGNMQSYSVQARENLLPDSAAVWRLGARVQLTQQRTGRAERSEYYLYYLPRIRVKVRTTFVESGERAQLLRSFVRELIPALVPPRT